jgi:protein ImuB
MSDEQQSAKPEPDGRGAGPGGNVAVDQPWFACLYQPPLPHLRAVPPDRDSARQADAASHDGAGAADQSASSDGRAATADRLVAIAADFSPRYEQHRTDLVSIDVRGLSRLLGTPRTIGAELRREAAARGVRVHVAIAPTRIGALVLAIARPGLTVVNAGSLAGALASVPLTVLEQLHEDPLPTATSAAQARLRADEARAAMASLKRWGLRTLGELAALPAADLSARLGRGGRVWQAIARGGDTRPLVPMQPDERFEGTMQLEWPIEGAEPLSFVLTRLLEPLSTRLERRDRGAAVLHVQLGLVTREVHACRLELPSPLREVRALRTLALLDIESHPPSAAVDTVTVVIEPTPGRILQHALFTRPHPTPEQLSTLLARLGALMGQDRVGTPAVVDSYRPGAFAMAALSIEGGRPSTADSCAPTSALRPPVSALRRCRQPVPARVVMDAALRPLRVSSDRRGFAGGTVLACAGPWRTSGAWWEEEPQKLELRSEKLAVSAASAPCPAEAADHRDARRRGPWSRDEWDVALADGAVYRIFRDRVTDGWFIDAVVD